MRDQKRPLAQGHRTERKNARDRRLSDDTTTLGCRLFCLGSLLMFSILFRVRKRFNTGVRTWDDAFA